VILTRRHITDMVRIKIMKPGTRPERVGLSEATLSKETSFKGKVLQAVVDSWCKIQVIIIILFLNVIF